jgi:hypothetical protein
MTHLTAFFKPSLIASFTLLIVLLVFGIFRKDMILSDTAASRIMERWREFKAAFFLGILGILFYLALILLEFIDVEQGLPFRSTHPLASEYISLFLIVDMVFLNLVSLHIVYKVFGGGK